MSQLVRIKNKFKKSANPKQAEILSGFFKTGKGEYGEGDKFLGIKVPVLRQTVKDFHDMTLTDLRQLLNSEYHEHRLSALFILTRQYKTADKPEKYVKFYLQNLKAVNNWDLVDLSAPQILGDWLIDHDREILYRLAKNENLWEKRVAILATFAFIKNNDFKDTLKIAKMLLHEDHDLLHKAVGWMLREVGKRDLAIEEEFLRNNDYRSMPRTLLRYAIEKFPEVKRQKYLKK